MQLSILSLTFARTLLHLVSGEACVAGGPADQVTAANTCRKELTGTWCDTETNQGICVLPDWATFWWKLCVLEIPGSVSLLDMRCIPGDGVRI